MKAIGYIRVSTEEQASEGVSIQSQEKKLRAWADLNDYELEIFTDAGLSGMKRNRPGLDEALKALKAGNALVVYSLSRLSRSTRDTLEISDMLAKKKCDLVSLSEKIDTTSAAGKMVFQMLAVLNEFERNQCSERTKTALSYKKAKGERVGTIKFGYKMDQDGKTLIPDAYEQKVLTAVNEYKAGGLSLRNIADRLEKRGLLSQRSNKRYSHTQVSNMLKVA